MLQRWLKPTHASIPALWVTPNDCPLWLACLLMTSLMALLLQPEDPLPQFPNRGRAGIKFLGSTFRALAKVHCFMKYCGGVGNQCIVRLYVILV